MSTSLDLITSEVNRARDSFLSALTDKSLSFEKESEFAIQALMKNDFAMTTALNNKPSLLAAVKNIAAIGISLNPAKKQAYLVPRDKMICLDISYMGLLDIAVSSGSIKWGQARLVRSNDQFTLRGMGEEPIHKFSPFASEEERGAVIGAFVTVKTIDGDFLTETMSTEEINGIMRRSTAWQAVENKKAKSSPWHTDYGEMAKKTVIKRAYKMWPKTDRMDQAIHHLNTVAGEGLNFNDGNTIEAVNVAPYLERIAACTTSQILQTEWHKAAVALQDYPVSYDEVKQAVIQKALALKQNAPAPAPKTISADLDDTKRSILLDLEAVADEGLEAFERAWKALSQESKELFGPYYDDLLSKATLKGNQ